jgi:trk system potassium uptake protein TrkA
MYIVILGAGDLGSSIATHLSLENNDITVVDLNASRLEKLQSRLDIQTICGHASYPDILIQAGIQDADVLLAVTNSDEVNMIACQISYSLFKTPLKIARIRSSHYASPQLYANFHIPIDIRISPELLVTSALMRIIEFPGAQEVLDFYHGEILLASIEFNPQHPLIDSSFETLKGQLKDLNCFPVALYQQKKFFIIHDDFCIKPNDQVYFLGTHFAMHQLLSRLIHYNHSNFRIMIGGAGHIGSKLAKNLESHYQVKVIERDPMVANQIASDLNHSYVLQGDIADSELLISENIHETDIFCAVTNEDEANIMSCLQAKHLGAKQTIALVNRKTYVPLIEDSPIDHAISPEMISASHILTKIRRGHMLKVHRLQNTSTEMIELILVDKDEQMNVIGKRLNEIEMPKGCSILAVIRQNELMEPTAHFKFHKHDHLIILMIDPKSLNDLEQIFQMPFK